MASAITFDEFDCECDRSTHLAKKARLCLDKGRSHIVVPYLLFQTNQVANALLRTNPEVLIKTREELEEIYECLIKLKSNFNKLISDLTQYKKQGNTFLFYESLFNKTLETVSLIDEHLEAFNISRNQESYEAINALISNLGKTSSTRDWRDELERL
jgi:predicted CopG family antitoxin